MRVSSHALQRYAERMKTFDSRPVAAAKHIARCIETGARVRPLKPSERIGKLLTHGVGAQYITDYRMVVVLVPDDNAVVTIYQYLPDRWERIEP